MTNDEILQTDWFVLEDLFQYGPMALEPSIAFMSRHYEPWRFVSTPTSIHLYKQGRIRMCYPKKAWEDMQQKNLEIFLDHPEYLDTLHEYSDNTLAPPLTDHAEQLLQTDISAVSDEWLSDWYQTYRPLEVELQAIRAIAWTMEMGERAALTEYLLEYLEKQCKKMMIDENPGVLFSLLLTPTKGTAASDAERNILLLAKQTKDKGRKFVAHDPEIESHVQKYKYLTYGIEGPGTSAEEVLSHIHALQNENMNEMLAQDADRFSRIQHDQEVLLKKLQCDDKHEEIFRVAKDISFQKAYSKEVQYLGWYACDQFLKEVARRLHLSWNQARYFLPDEIVLAVTSGVYDEHVLNERYRSSMLAIGKDNSRFIIGQEAEDLLSRVHLSEKEKHIDENVKEFSGQTAVLGKATGTVKIVNVIEDIQKMNVGDILVSEMTIPEIVPAMKKAAAIVTNQGGIVCHAAIISRELGKPCIIGTKIATHVLKDGDMVEVDADNGKIHIIEKKNHV
ncbi:MAG: Phosphoenolpyruvate synthase/pyruvate phosphate dikinase [Candidatus Magasanikbacteria bacterium GW2011_GWD2_43_18]|uniref:Phosphoenolpyruvate synthase/pyruvate phosphate dikinase n=1 Tax=Candidatus Magasanikbacteria bacterium GW2011_GWE2_42_7 TaxID=1619052 RepID=A0A0G1B9K9_9BACT|nr:MAG: Phosphoenolpyruvate synthase/pyruvate phosphate dikinase [Candidatus Magasanikbacteria bacterium GW2011_GWC2_42_27]KKS69972.1 MAG: Phosphoenolpyruvate synthase/pyruvate phosphate dikinase [Candidatus Magasanikbacteria bacterium GW2011_GWE2_42_7]KKT04428.1 MAG: Phosphoenolpyruvate synthase/pyruvate phosphate dikinase [Candidatus Magasanikbacteria bacterium GW2011_GWD2_43_18]KKT26061.1 MAG: Phosphoenolpyruvate synthase/pyruvate phosphate dikinase [Candidatus Magasanikbacteria bacterium GW2